MWTSLLEKENYIRMQMDWSKPRVKVIQLVYLSLSLFISTSCKKVSIVTTIEMSKSRARQERILRSLSSDSHEKTLTASQPTLPLGRWSLTRNGIDPTNKKSGSGNFFTILQAISSCWSTVLATLLAQLVRVVLQSLVVWATHFLPS